jgi:hypothetical protein
MLAESLKEAFTDFGQNSQRIFSDHVPASIDYAVIVSNIYEATDDQRGNESMMGVPIRCYLATATQVYLKAWQQSNTSCDVHGTPLTWTKITGGIRSWPQFNHDRADVNDPENGADVLAECGTRSYFEARGRMWTFSGKLEVPPRTADDGDFLRMAREAFHAAASLGTRGHAASLSFRCTAKSRN